jgi:hypothetical protein
MANKFNINYKHININNEAIRSVIGVGMDGVAL